MEEGDTAHPAEFLGPNADPGAIGTDGIACHQLTGDTEAADHALHQGCVVSPPCFLCQYCVQDCQRAVFDF